jgi:hypothetical protein
MLLRLASYSPLAHAAFRAETPQDEEGDDVRNLAALRGFFGPPTARDEQ